MAKPNFSSALVAAGALGLVVWPLFFREAPLYYQVMGMACLYGTLALAWNVFALTGAVSLGHAAFFGLGAYGSALLDHYWHWSPLLTIPLGALLGAAYGASWGLFFKRLRGVYLGLASLAALEIPKVIADNWESLTYGSLGMVGLSSLPTLELGQWQVTLGADLRAQYYLLLAVMVLVALIHKCGMQSRWGWALRAMRENETAAAIIGIKVNRSRAQALLLSSYLTGICGALYAHLLGLIEPALVFNLHISALPLVMSIFGGRGRFYGPVLGAMVLYPLDQLVFQPWLPLGHAAIFGLVIVLTILFFPQGIAAWIPKARKYA
jgi:branched-chain amino acid transport system permease protein